MSGLTYRDTKLSELTHDEVDENFRYLEQKANIYEVGQVYRGPVQKIYNGQLYLLSPGVTFPFTAANFVTELAAGNWQLVGSGTSYKGELNLTTPVLENGTGTIGDYYKVVQDGDYDFGAGEVHYNNGDFVLYDGAVYGPYVDNNQLFSSLFNKKDFDKTQSFTATGTDVVIPFHLYGYGTIELSGALTSVSGFSFTDLIASPENAEYPHEGKEIVIINRSGHDITLKNEDYASTAVVFFKFDSPSNIVIPNDGKLRLKNNVSGLQDIFKSWIDVSDKLDKVSTVTAERQFYAKKADGTFEMVNQSDIAGGGGSSETILNYQRGSAISLSTVERVASTTSDSFLGFSEDITKSGSLITGPFYMLAQNITKNGTISKLRYRYFPDSTDLSIELRVYCFKQNKDSTSIYDARLMLQKTLTAGSVYTTQKFEFLTADFLDANMVDGEFLAITCKKVGSAAYTLLSQNLTIIY